MIVQIDINSLQPSNNETIFRAGVITSLHLISQWGLSLKIDKKELSKGQQQLLEQENLVLEKEGSSSDFKIETKGSTLLLLNSNEDVIAESINWKDIAKELTQSERKAALSRKTSETDITVDVNLDGSGKSKIDTGLKFFDHMLEQIARHGLVDLNIHCKGDLEIDEHHTIEDVAIALGETISKALGDKKGLERYGFVLAMDEAQATVALDLSNRPFLVFNVPMKREYVGDFPTEMLEHFFYSLAMNLKTTLHVTCTGSNDHHKIEACFKGFARSLKMAIEQNGRIKNQIPSSKGSL